MQRSICLLPHLALAYLMMAQTPWPPHCIGPGEWVLGTHHTAVSQPIEAPCSPSTVAIWGAADAEFVSGAEVHLMEGFHAGTFNDDGQFHAYIDGALGAPADLVLISPHPGAHIVDDMVHVEKWEKLEIGLRLPAAYQAAVDSFFAHYYSNGVNADVTVDSLDRDHDLNPYADDSLLLVMTLTSPTGQHHMKWGFFMKEAKWAGFSPEGSLIENLSSALYPYHIRFRFAPDEQGLWQFTLSLKAPFTHTSSGTPLTSHQYTGYAFLCDPPLDDNHGFLHVNPVNRRTLQFDDSSAFFGLGTNVVGPSGGHPADESGFLRFHRHGFDELIRTMDQLHGVGGNFMRFWLGARYFGPEYVNVGVYDRYHATCPCAIGNWPLPYNSTCQGHCWAMDSILDRARADDLYVQLTTEGERPAVAYEQIGWGSHAYVRHFLEPSARPYDVKKFFFTDGNPDSTDSGVFYYWKRKYKYMMARWGYSVNLAIIEPFNETDGTLTYNGTDFSNGNQEVCFENNVNWERDSLLPFTMDQWLTKLMDYVRDPVDPSDPVRSPLGEDKKLFLMSYTGGQAPSDTVNYYPFLNPDLDLIDIHKYNNTQEDLKNSADVAATYRATYDKPFHQGEYLTWGTKNTLINDTTSEDLDTWKYFHNYDVSFHNEIWASTFFGSFANASNWGWDRIFWWPGAVPLPLDDIYNIWQTEPFSNVLDSTNRLNIGIEGGYPIVNKPVHHNFKPVADLLNNPDWQSYGFFNGDFAPFSIYDTISGLECYYLVNDAGSLAIGWVHNANAYWDNHFYMNTATQNFLGCTPPNADSIALPGFAQEHDYVITYFPTRINATPPPADTVTSTLTGQVTLNLSDTAFAFGGTANNYLDTLHTDYAFIIAPEMILRSMIANEAGDSAAVMLDWDFAFSPNPAQESVVVQWPSDDVPRDVALFDLSGKRVFHRQNITTSSASVSLNGVSKGTYCIRLSDTRRVKMKILIIQ